MTESSELHKALPMKWLSIRVQKLNIVLMRVVPLMVPILISGEYIISIVRSSAIMRKYF